MAPRTQLGAPSIVNTILRGRDINRTYVQGRWEGDECFPKVEIKVINDVLLLLLFSHGALAAQGTKESRAKVSKGLTPGMHPALCLAWPVGIQMGPSAEPCEVRARLSWLLWVLLFWWLSQPPVGRRVGLDPTHRTLVTYCSPWSSQYRYTLKQYTCLDYVSIAHTCKHTQVCIIVGDRIHSLFLFLSPRFYANMIK